jgi:hypothetical protein
MPDTANQKTYPAEYLAGTFIAGLILGVVVAWLWFGIDPSALSHNSATSTATSTPADTHATSAPDAAQKATSTASTSPFSSILVISSQPAGLSVTVDKAVVTASQWVVIHEDRNGAPGNALGAARFLGGLHAGVVNLLRATVAGRTYHGLIYKDNGDRMFSKDKDVPLKDSSGATIDVTFTATE